MSTSRRFKCISISLIAIFIFLLGLFTVPLDYTRAAEPLYLDLSVSMETTATEVEPDEYRYILKGETFTFAYAMDVNDGLDLSYWWPLYDASAFALTSFTVSDKWTLRNGYAYLDNEGKLVAEESVESFIAHFNADYAAHEADPSFEPAYECIVFEVESNEPGDYPTSSVFFTVTYTARTDLRAGADYVFGFDFEPIDEGDGIFLSTTNAAKYGAPESLIIRLLSGDEYLDMSDPAYLSRTTYTAHLVPSVVASLPENQTIRFKNGSLDLSDIAYVIDYPLTEEGEVNPYLADNGTVTFVLYETEDAEQPMEGVPTAVGDYYVKAIFDSTEHYKGVETDRVRITVKKEDVSIGELNAITSISSTPIPAEGNVLTVVVDYGVTVTVREGSTAFDLSKYLCSFYVESGAGWAPITDNLFISHRMDVARYKAIVLPKDPEYQEFEGDIDEYIVYITVKRVNLKVTANSYIITYGDSRPELGYTFDGLVEWDSATAIFEELGATLTLADAYAEENGAVSDYLITLSVANTTITNYNVTLFANGWLTVAPKELVIEVIYEGAEVSFDVGGFIAGEESTPVTYSLTDQDVGYSVELDGNAYAAYNVWAYDYQKANPNQSQNNAPSAAPTETSYLTSALSVDAEEPTGNYSVTAVALRKACRVSYLSNTSMPYSGIPETAYLFSGSTVEEPTSPSAMKSDFLGWAVGGEAYTFEDELTGDIQIVARFVQVEFDFELYAAQGDDYENRLPMTYDGTKFVLAETSAPVVFRMGTEISLLSDVNYFRIAKWIKATPSDAGYVYEDISVFAQDATSEHDSGIYLIAVMTLDVSAGDANGDRAITTDDLIRIRKYSVLIDYSSVMISTEAEAWAKVTAEAPTGGFFFRAALDADGDGYFGILDIIYISQVLAGGYTEYAKVTDATVDGIYHAGDRLVSAASVIEVATAEELLTFADSGMQLLLTEDVTVTGDVVYDGANFKLDLGGHTLTTGKCVLRAKGIVTTVGASITDPNGNLSETVGTFTVNVKGNITIKNGTIACAANSVAGQGGTITE